MQTDLLCPVMSNGVLLSLSGQVALITGGSRGIGAACVRMFREAGAQVTFNYQQARETAEQLVEECGAEQTHAVRADLDNTGSGAELVRAAVERFGALDCLVVNHGVWP